MSQPLGTASGSDAGTSTLASGPAGTHFEGQVGASYLLAMLSGAPPRGLPGTSIDTVALQQSNAGYPLDDVVVHAHNWATGKSAVMEIQVKRSITFAPADPVFRKVVGQIVKASQRPDFMTQRYELAIATAKGSSKIDGSYQDVLTLARNAGDAAAFANQLNLPGIANEDMRNFVLTFKSHLRDEAVSDDDGTVWLLLSRLLILTFDFTAGGSASHDLALERAVRVLHPDDGSRAAALWVSLIELAIDVAKSGGQSNRETTLESLAQQGYRFVGERRNTAARAALADSARLTLADIENQVGGVVLMRADPIRAVREALDSGRYVEIRGDAGVGKSGVLRQMADAMQTEGQIIVLSPGRCVLRGWDAMRSQLGFDGTLHELLVELANDGGVTIFVDNLDSFNRDERPTVIDVVRGASLVRGVSVIATARLQFGIDEPSWMPRDAIARMGQSAHVTIGELSKTEILQLTSTDPSLGPLLTDSHPARKVARNLFRLARLAILPAAELLPRTEVDMAEQWWVSADGERDAGWRDRTRLLQAIAEQIADGADFLDVRGQPAPPIDALVKSGTLRNLGIDRVAFRHDVLSEWALANAVHANPGLVTKLPLDRPATAMLARGIELAARMAIERAKDGVSWYALTARLSEAVVHRSWRRAALLALARSEGGEAILERAAPELFAHGALLLRELLLTVMAVEVVAASKAFTAAGLDSSFIPESANIPRGPAWTSLLIWLLSRGDNIPDEAIPEVVQLYSAFSFGTFGKTDFTPFTTQQIYRWLRLMELRDEPSVPREGHVFWTHLDRAGAQSLQSDLHDAFVMFARTTPELAAQYLTTVGNIERNEDIVRSILNMRGTLAEAAPAELAELTFQALIRRPQRPDRYVYGERDEAFTFLDHEFLQPSPVKGPFLELLNSSPQVGLSLLHRLVAHAISHASRGVDPGTNNFVLVFSREMRSFPWTQTYFWSRDSNYYSVTSALMALEAWAHRRIESGETFSTVLTDVLGPPGSCAAFLLVAVDLVISHWPASLDVAVGFLGCPELLCIDLQRKFRDRVEVPDFTGLGELWSEPKPCSSATALRRRKSRQITLDELIGKYTFLESDVHRTNLKTLLHEAGARLPKPAIDANLRDPAFMVQYALNLLEVSNWHDVEVPRSDGSLTMARKYVSPAIEQNHLQALREAAAEGSLDFEMQTALSELVKGPGSLLPRDIEILLTWARRSSTATSEGKLIDVDEQRVQREAFITAAMVTMRDGTSDLRAEYGEWATSILKTALKTLDSDPALRNRIGLRFNPTAIAFAGWIYGLRNKTIPDDVSVLLELAAARCHTAAHGFGAVAAEINALDSRLLRSILRCAFSACVIDHRVWGENDDKIATRMASRSKRAEEAVAAETAWLNSSGAEPAWPLFPPLSARARRKIRLPGANAADQEIESMLQQSEVERVDDQAAALWLGQIDALPDATVPRWLSDIVTAYMPWTLVANGSELIEGEEPDQLPFEWNHAFFSTVARCIPGKAMEEVTDFAVRHIVGLPDKGFYALLAIFLRSVDALYFQGGGISTEVAVNVREIFVSRMLKTRGWGRLARTKDLSIDRDLGPAIAVLFFNDQNFGKGPSCYLLEKGAERLNPFLPVLGKLVQAGPSPFLALVLLNLLEVAPRPPQLELVVSAGRSWVETYPNFGQMWLDHRVGRRWCLLVDAIRVQSPPSFSHQYPIRSTVDSVVAALIALGVAEAARLEEQLQKI